MNKEIEYVIEYYVNIFLNKVSEEYEISYDLLKEEWDSFNYREKFNKKEIKNIQNIQNIEKPIKIKIIDDEDDIYNKKCMFSGCKNEIGIEKTYCKKHVMDIVKMVCKSGEGDVPYLRLNKSVGKFVHRCSGMVFYSKEYLYVFGKLRGGDVVRLNREDEELCKDLHFRVDKSKYEEYVNDIKEYYKNEIIESRVES